MNPSPNYECIHEEQLQDNSIKLKALEKEVNFKKEKIEELKKSMETMDKKLDNIDKCLNDLKQQSAQDDFNIDTNSTIESINLQLIMQYLLLTQV